MGPIAKGEKGNADDIGRAWMLRAIAKAQMRLGEGHLGAVHVFHHPLMDTGTSNVKGAGFIVPRRVEMRTYEESKSPVLIGDLIHISAEVFAELKDGRLPYRSAEVIKWEDDEIASLALLPTETPYSRLPMLTNFVEVSATTLSEVAQLSASTFHLAASLAAAVESGAIRFQEDRSMPIPGEREDGGANMMEDDEHEEKKEMQEEMQPEGTTLETIASMLAEILERLPAPESAQEDVVEPNAMKAGGSSKEVARLTAKLASVETRLDTRDKSDAATQLQAGAIKSLDGWPVSEKVRAHVASLSAKGDAGAVKEFCEVYRQNTPKDPPANLSAFEHQATPRTKEPAEVAKYAEEGAEVYAKARELEQSYAKLRAGGFRMKSTLAEFLSVNMDAEVPAGR